jgi:hypothetical protein
MARRWGHASAPNEPYAALAMEIAARKALS